jgi:hypothetical protein
MRTMYDSVTPTNILLKDPHPQMVAGYLNGTFAWSQADWDLFPNSVHVTISTQARWTVGHVLDVENGDATPAQSVGWVQARRAGGFDPTVYCNLSTWPLVKADFDAAGVVQPHYWIALYDGSTTIPAGAVAKQYIGNVSPGIDISSVADFWPGVDSVAPSGTTYQEDNFMRVEAGPNVHTTIPCNGFTRIYIAIGFGKTVDGNMWFLGNTPSGSGAAFLGTSPTAFHADPDRPGPFPVPANCRHVSLETTSTVPFTAWCAD